MVYINKGASRVQGAPKGTQTSKVVAVTSSLVAATEVALVTIAMMIRVAEGAMIRSTSNPMNNRRNKTKSWTKRPRMP